MTKRKPTVKSLKRKLDRIFSEYIRRRDSQPDGYGHCCTCGKVLKWQDGDCCHFIRRACNNTRFNEKNCNLGCRHCNRGGERNASYAAFLIERYGPNILTELAELEHQTKRWFTWELEELIEIYTKKLGELK